MKFEFDLWHVAILIAIAWIILLLVYCKKKEPFIMYGPFHPIYDTKAEVKNQVKVTTVAKTQAFDIKPVEGCAQEEYGKYPNVFGKKILSSFSYDKTKTYGDAYKSDPYQAKPNSEWRVDCPVHDLGKFASSA
jgi:hypothetical protein